MMITALVPFLAPVNFLFMDEERMTWWQSCERKQFRFFPHFYLWLDMNWRHNLDQYANEFRSRESRDEPNSTRIAYGGKDAHGRSPWQCLKWKDLWKAWRREIIRKDDKERERERERESEREFKKRECQKEVYRKNSKERKRTKHPFKRDKTAFYIF